MAIRIPIGLMIIALVSGVLALPGSVAGHGLGESFEQEVGDHLIDVGYTPEDFSAGASALFEFELWENEPGVAYEDLTPVPFDDVWVRIVADGKTVFAGGVHNAEFGGARMTYVFPEPGEYEFSVRYERGTDSIAETTFPFTVAPREGGGSFRIPAMAAVLGLLVGAGGVYFIRR